MAVVDSPKGRPRLQRTLHVVTGDRSPLGRAVKATIPPNVLLSIFRDAGLSKGVEHGDLVIVDLTDSSTRISQVSLTNLIGSAETWLVASDDLSSIALAALRPSHVRVFTVHPGNLDGYRELMDKLSYRLSDVEEGAMLAMALIRRDGALGRVADLVTTICARPKDVRRPRDLSRMSGRELRDVRSLLVSLGFSRTEHFIIAVKMLALEQLIGLWDVPPSKARVLLGLEDSTNSRRQLRRAARGSPTVIARLCRVVA